MIFFSVIIPAYNRAALIAETIESVLAQTYPHYEMLIIDDGSTDGTGELIKTRYGQNPRVNYFYKHNAERGAARNFGLEQARGDFAVFLDSDDIMLPEYLSTLARLINQHPGVRLLATKYNYINKGRTEQHPGLKKLASGWYGRDYFLKGNVLACNFCVKRKGFSCVLFPEDRELVTMEDWLFLLANLKENKIYISNDVCVSMRQHDNRSMMDNQKVIAARKKATEWIRKHIELTDAESRKLTAWSHYFCGVHQYLDDKRGAAVSEVISAIRQNGFQVSYLILLAKALAGRKLIQQWK